MNKIEKYGGLYSKWYNLAFWIVGISLVIGVIFTLFMGKEFSIYNVLLPSLFNTACLWLRYGTGRFPALAVPFAPS